ncbi:hypothetical protein [Pseudobacillus wudalianchiensis]|uniref:Uncharacterized protein n=1 Tax=Pseudobacillus wudalianchiensis TaxID=1743143 RepID=A0A1B9BA38_9BACI|nr:hypothetical protein [Bacillus wudalianchiensis]OCA92942.1 hypothetical protein A8F95_04465 [Bacillus wudalianchiensis]
MKCQQSKNKEKDKSENAYEKKKLELEKEVALGLWVQVIGQIIEIRGLSGLLYIEEDEDSIGEQQILTGVWIKTIGQLLESVSVTSQIGETNAIRLLQEQKVAIAGDVLASIGSAFEVIGGLRVLKEERAAVTSPRIIP